MKNHQKSPYTSPFQFSTWVDLQTYEYRLLVVSSGGKSKLRLLVSSMGSLFEKAHGLWNQLKPLGLSSMIFFLSSRLIKFQQHNQTTNISKAINV